MAREHTGRRALARGRGPHVEPARDRGAAGNDRFGANALVERYFFPGVGGRELCIVE